MENIHFNGYFHSFALPSFPPQTSCVFISSSVHLRKPAKPARKRPCWSGFRLAGVGVCCRSHKSVGLILLRKRSCREGLTDSDSPAIDTAAMAAPISSYSVTLPAERAQALIFGFVFFWARLLGHGRRFAAVFSTFCPGPAKLPLRQGRRSGLPACTSG